MYISLNNYYTTYGSDSFTITLNHGVTRTQDYQIGKFVQSTDLDSKDDRSINIVFRSTRRIKYILSTYGDGYTQFNLLDNDGNKYGVIGTNPSSIVELPKGDYA